MSMHHAYLTEREISIWFNLPVRESSTNTDVGIFRDNTHVWRIELDSLAIMRMFLHTLNFPVPLNRQLRSA